jgi:S-DNA-T family DNA segregation ATPase FtsK/SpoIIIE
MLFRPSAPPRCSASRAPTSTRQQIASLTEFWRRQGEPEFRAELLEEVEPDAPQDPRNADEDGFDPDEDPLLEDAIALVVEMGPRIDLDAPAPAAARLHARRARVIDMLERRGIISGYEGSKPRQVLRLRGRYMPQ